MGTPLINSSFLEGFEQILIEHKLDPADVLAPIGLPVECLRNNNLLISLVKFIELLDIVAEKLNKQDLCLELVRRQGISVLGPLVHMLIQGETVGDAVERILRYMNMIVRGVEITLLRQESMFEISISTQVDSIRHNVQFQNYAMASTYRSLSELMGAKVKMRGVFFNRSENNIEIVTQYSQYFACPVAFNQSRLSITADIKLLNLPIELLENNLSTALFQFFDSVKDEDFIKQVQRLITHSLITGKCDIDTVAVSMGLSRRTLQRKLDKHGKQYSDMIKEIRAGLAIQYLNSDYYRLTDIALLLGYKNQSAFTRSFIDWYGEKPSDVRKRNFLDKIRIN